MCGPLTCIPMVMLYGSIPMKLIFLLDDLCIVLIVFIVHFVQLIPCGSKLTKYKIKIVNLNTCSNCMSLSCIAEQ